MQRSNQLSVEIRSRLMKIQWQENGSIIQCKQRLSHWIGGKTRQSSTLVKQARLLLDDKC